MPQNRMSALQTLNDAIKVTRGNAIVLNSREFEALKFLIKDLHPTPSPTVGQADSSNVRLNSETALRLILDSVDYTSGACRVNEMVGAVLPTEIIIIARKALENE